MATQSKPGAKKSAGKKPVKGEVAKLGAQSPGILGGAPLPQKKIADAVAVVKPKTAVVMGGAANDPTRQRQHRPVTMPPLLYCGVAGIRPPVSAGFTAWAAISGHNEHTRPEWDALYASYLASPVRS